MACAKFETHLRKAKTRANDDPWVAVGSICDLYTPAEFWNNLQHGGYGADQLLEALRGVEWRSASRGQVCPRHFLFIEGEIKLIPDRSYFSRPRWRTVKPTRRDILRAAGAIALLPGSLACAPPRQQPQSTGRPLHELAEAAGLFYGAAAFLPEIQPGSPVRLLLERECSHIVPEMELNWDHLVTEGDHLRMDEYADRVRQMGKSLHGHTLLWHNSTPRWVQDALQEKPDWNIVASHIRSTIARYGPEIEYWEVINEPLDTGYREDGLRGASFLKAFGPEYIGMALEEAGAADPSAKLLINEFSLDYDIPVERERRHHMLRLLERLLKAGIPLHGLGVQAHLDLQKGPFSQRIFADFLTEVSDLGLEILITELDVRESDLIATPAERDQRVAEHVTEYLDVAMDQRALKGVITWGITDRHSWLELTEKDLARFPDAWQDGSGPGLNRGLPFDSDLRPKPMYEALAGAFQKRAKHFERPAS